MVYKRFDKGPFNPLTEGLEKVSFEDRLEAAYAARRRAEKRAKSPSLTSSSSLSEFIADDFKLFVSPVTAVLNELKRQLRS
jgi:hypothetical protein